MKFAHIADCHVGGWREPKLREVNKKSFISVIDYCLKIGVDFLLLSGDLFNTAMPPMDSLRIVVEQLKKLADQNIPVYAIPGSHDFSPAGKTILDVLESAGLMQNVCTGQEVEGKLRLDFVIDPKTKIKITGLLGKKGGLEKNYFYNLDKKHLEEPSTRYKIFMFHSAISELKPKGLEKMDAMPVSLLPKNFNYYAGGHVHVIDNSSISGYENIVYPGPIYPNSFSELEKLKKGGFVIVDNGHIQHLKIEPHPVISLDIDCENKTPEEANSELIDLLNDIDLKETIVTLRAKGCLRTGNPTDIKFKEFFKKAYAQGAYFVMKNTNKLVSKEFEEIKTNKNSVEEIEDTAIGEHAGQLGVFEAEREKEIAKEMIRVMSYEKEDGEKTADFECRVRTDVDALLEL
ncbi:DNA repair exonuclease [Candidatus Woesearchaeota archaeon]|nr:DNA repair exonuclease [Candidatus Woesearchaeota archaeon]